MKISRLLLLLCWLIAPASSAGQNTSLPKPLFNIDGGFQAAALDDGYLFLATRNPQVNQPDIRMFRRLDLGVKEVGRFTACFTRDGVQPILDCDWTG